MKSLRISEKNIRAFWAKILESMGKPKDGCFCCGMKKSKLERTHILGRHSGGKDIVENLHMLCSYCHKKSEFIFGKNYWNWFLNAGIVLNESVINAAKSISEATKRALSKKKERLELVSGSPPYGFRLAADGIHLERDEKEQATIAQVKALRAEGLTLREIGSKLLTDMKIPRSGKMLWHPQTIKNIIGSKTHG